MKIFEIQKKICAKFKIQKCAKHIQKMRKIKKWETKSKESNKTPNFKMKKVRKI